MCVYIIKKKELIRARRNNSKTKFSNTILCKRNERFSHIFESFLIDKKHKKKFHI